jgi:hypothetical protein
MYFTRVKITGEGDMFRENNGHLQEDIFSTENQFSDFQRKRFEKSKEVHFYSEVFCRIDETLFDVLYSKKYSRPNSPVNSLVGSLILQEARGWTDSTLFDEISFNLLVRHALGLQDSTTIPFNEATYYNFQNRLLAFEDSTGINLMDEVRKSITAKQLKEYEVNGEIQRMDSFQLFSNIRKRNRVELLVEVLIRLYRALPEELQAKIKPTVLCYTEKTSVEFVGGLPKAEMPHALELLAKVYREVHDMLQECCSELPEFKNIARAMNDHFSYESEKIIVREPKDIPSGALQSPDDTDATFRTKSGKNFQGFVGNVTETATVTEIDPETNKPVKKLRLITDVAVEPNIVQDVNLLKNRLPEILALTPELNELHADGAYGGPTVDPLLKTHEIVLIQTAVTGGKAIVEMSYEVADSGGLLVSCPFDQTVESQLVKSNFKAEFDDEKCSKCPFEAECPAKKSGKVRVFRFGEKAVNAAQRRDSRKNIPVERQTLRANVEATVKEFVRLLNHKGKLKTRGLFKARLFAIAASIYINCGRIYRMKVA